MAPCPTSLGHALSREASNIVHIIHRCKPGRAQMSSGWLAGWLAGTGTHSLEMCAQCMSHTVTQPAEDSPRYKKSSNAVVASRM